MSFGNWSISKKCFDYIVENTPAGGTILEFGSGWGSGELSKDFQVWSIENDLMWLGRFHTNYIYGHIRWYDNFAWYDIEEIRPQLPRSYDTILIDGPPADIGRVGFLHFMEHFDTGALIIIDDVHCRFEKDLFIQVASRLGRPCHIVKEGAKSFGVIERAHNVI